MGMRENNHGTQHSSLCSGIRVESLAIWPFAGSFLRIHRSQYICFSYKPTQAQSFVLPGYDTTSNVMDIL
jgi:hypothetical protein